MKTIISRGNRKLPKETVIFNIPAIKTCPGATEACKKHCYARKAEICYPNVLPFRENNFIISKEKDFPEIMEAELGKIKFDRIRHCESGDFYSQTYFNKWVDIINKIKPNIGYAYTKNINLDLKDKPKNMILLFSDDNNKYKRKELLLKGYNGKASVVNKGYKIKRGEILCPGDCTTCNICYIRPSQWKNIKFEKH